MGKLRKSYNIYRISGLKSLWLAFNRDILNRDTRAEFARDHIRELNKKEDLAVAEVGVWKGEHADIIQRQLDVEKMYLIDPYDAYDEYNENKSDAEKMANAKKKAHERLSGYDNTVWIKKISSEAVKDITDSLDYVYIDGNHQYEYVLEDISKYYSLLKSGGTLAGHNFTGGWPGVIRAVTDFADEKGLRFNLEPRGSDWYLIKPE